jgi:cytochrome c oxidase assembly protein Cox11
MKVKITDDGSNTNSRFIAKLYDDYFCIATGYGKTKDKAKQDLKVEIMKKRNELEFKLQRLNNINFENI